MDSIPENQKDMHLNLPSPSGWTHLYFKITGEENHLQDGSRMVVVLQPWLLGGAFSDNKQQGNWQHYPFPPCGYGLYQELVGATLSPSAPPLPPPATEAKPAKPRPPQQTQSDAQQF